MGKELTVYLRENGPICYEVEVLPMNDRQSLDKWTSELFDIKLTWYWESGRARPKVKHSQYSYLPEFRPPTILDISTKEIFLDDLSERDVDEYARFIVIFGVDSNSQTPISDVTHLKSALREFLTLERSQIRIIIIQIGDSPWENVFVPHRPAQPVKQVLRKWGIDESLIRRKRSYEELYNAKLELLAESIFACASMKSIYE